MIVMLKSFDFAQDDSARIQGSNVTLSVVEAFDFQLSTFNFPLNFSQLREFQN